MGLRLTSRGRKIRVVNDLEIALNSTVGLRPSTNFEGSSLSVRVLLGIALSSTVGLRLSLRSKRPRSLRPSLGIALSSTVGLRLLSFKIDHGLGILPADSELPSAVRWDCDKLERGLKRLIAAL